jgi:hypothetical protein
MPPIPFRQLGIGSEIVRGKFTFYFGESMRHGSLDDKSENRAAQPTATVIDQFPWCVHKTVQ